MNESKLNIILLTHNNLESTKKCIANLYQFTSDFNLIIVDNDSFEDTLVFLRSIEKQYNIKIQYNKENVGIIKGRNQGYRIGGDSQYICFLDNDQFVQHGWLESYLDLMEKGYDVVGTEAWKMRKDFYPYKKIINKNEEFNYVGCGLMMINNKVIKDIGLFDERYEKFYFEDPDFCFRTYYRGYKIGWNYNKKADHQKHDLTLRGERKIYFMKNWQRFQEKWKGIEIPVFKVN